MAAGLAGDMTHILRGFFEIMPEMMSLLQPLGRVCDMLGVTPGKTTPRVGAKVVLQQFRGAIEFKNVNFAFPSEPLKQVLFDLIRSISPGAKIGFVWGYWLWQKHLAVPRRTMVQPDQRFHHLRRHMSVVAQQTTLFSTTIRENVVNSGSDA